MIWVQILPIWIPPSLTGPWSCPPQQHGYPHTCRIPQKGPGPCSWGGHLPNTAEMWIPPCCLLDQAQPAHRTSASLWLMSGTSQLHLLVLMFFMDFSSECPFKCICVGLCENIIYGKLCSRGPQQRQTQLLPSLTTNSTLPGPGSSHSTVPVPCECGKKCQEERQERALPEWTVRVRLCTLNL